MFIIEIIAKLLNNKYKIKPEVHNHAEIDEYEACEHFYVAIDSTKKYLACKNCGHIIKNTIVKKKNNFFIKEK